MYLPQVWCIGINSETWRKPALDLRRPRIDFHFRSFQSLCILPLNIVNEKTYIFIWFWYLILLTMLFGLLIYRLLIIFVPSVRARVLNARNRMVPREIAVAVSKKVDIGDWWIIYMLGRNLDPIIYKDVLAELAKSIPVPARKQKKWSPLHSTPMLMTMFKF